MVFFHFTIFSRKEKSYFHFVQRFLLRLDIFL